MRPRPVMSVVMETRSTRAGSMTVAVSPARVRGSVGSAVGVAVAAAVGLEVGAAEVEADATDVAPDDAEAVPPTLQAASRMATPSRIAVPERVISRSMSA